MSTLDDRLTRYARLLCEVGVDVQPGQQVAVNAQVEHAPLARAVAEQAYRLGAEYVDIWYFDPFAKQSRIRHAPEDSLGRTPSWLDHRYERLAESGGAVVNLAGDPHPRLLDGLPERRCGRDQMPGLAARFRVQRESSVAWVIGAYPTAGWASEVYGVPDVERLWADLSTCLRLDEPDPVAAWNARLDELSRRAEDLTRRELRTLHYQGEGTDLTVDLIPGAAWRISALEGPGGRRNVVNLPTEEVYTTPDRRTAEGTVTSTRPLAMMGTVVDPFTLTLEAGRIVDVRGGRGAGVVRQHVATDEGAGCLGELALVDSSSAVRRTGTVFKDTLLDENATCHIAWGGGIPTVFTDWRSTSPEELYERGVNQSSVHVDFMVGGPALEVSGVDRQGKEIPLLRGETWVSSS